MNVLFIGNSFTYYHDMPDLLMQIAKAAGVTLHAQHVTKGGYRLSQHCDWETEDGKRTLQALQSRQWDYVVLQDQSATPALHRDIFLPAARELCETVRRYGAKPVFYQTWSYQADTEKLATTGMSYKAFYGALKDAYREAGAQNDAPVVPVGDLFYQLNTPNGELELICPDHFHPSLLGSYAIAVCFYCRLVGALENPWWPEEVSAEQAEQIWSAIRNRVG